MQRTTFVSVFLGLVLLTNGKAYGWSSREVDWTQSSDEITFQEKEFKGAWNGKRAWTGLLCEGALTARADATGQVDKFDFALREDGQLDVTGEFSHLYVNLTGGYSSDLTFCSTVSLSHLVTIDRMSLKALVTFVEKGEDLPPEVKVKVLSTKISSMHFNLWLPEFMEKKLTDVVNKGLVKVWESRLGARINDKIAKEFKKKFPTP